MEITCPIITKNSSLGDQDYLAGVAVLIDKPKNWTSFDVVAKLRNTVGKKLGIKKLKVGHAGTLDPLATGLLILCIGKATKQIEAFQGLPKCYLADMKLGAHTKTYDAEAQEEDIQAVDHITESIIENQIATFRGEILQTPPIYSAIKVKGKALYKYARKGEEVAIKSRTVVIHDYTLKSYNAPQMQCEISCSKGTYIRSLAHDLGQQLGVGAYLSDLRRTAIGAYSIDDALFLPSFIERLLDEEV